MNRKEIENRFREYFFKDGQRGRTVPALDEQNILSFFFDTILPEVLTEVQKGISLKGISFETLKAYHLYQDHIEQKAKEKYNITL